MASRLLVVHADSLLARGYLSVSDDRRTPDGESAGALFAATRAVRRALAFKEPELAVAVFEVEADTSEWAPSLVSQHERFPDLLAAQGISVVTAERAADVVASYTEAAREAGHDVVVVGSDKRLAQLVGDDVWWYDAYKDVRYTPELVRKRFEVGPANVAEWLCLVGDDDTLPGVKGLGKKSATQLIEDHGTLDAAIESAEEIDGRAGKALRASIDDAKRELARARLDRGLALPRPLSELVFEAPETAALSALFAELGFFDLLEAREGRLEEVDVEICADDAAIAHALATLGDGPVALTALIEDPTPYAGALVGAALVTTDGPAFYFPLAGDAEIPGPLAAFLQDAERPKIGHDIKRAEVAFARRGVTVEGVIGDSGFASHLHQPSNWAPHDLDILARQVLHRPLVDEESVRGVGRSRKTWAKVPAAEAAAYAAHLARAAGEVWAELAPTTDETLLDEYRELSRTCIRMELRGIAVDGSDLESAGRDFDRIREELEEEIYGLADKTFNLGSTKQLGSVLYEDLGLPVVKRTKTGWSTATDALERIENAHPIVPLVIRWRLLRRLKDTWVTSLRESIADDGRVHSMFHPARSFSGRLVSSEPDLGRVPGKTPEMARIRHAFHAPEGRKLLSVDYEQLGLFVLAHLTKDPALALPLANRDDLHTLTAAAVLELAPEDVEKKERQIGKVVNFATFAGQGASALALQLGVEAAEAKEIIARFDRRYAVVRAFQDEQLELAQKRGYIETIAGRRWPIGDLRSKDQHARSYAERLARRATHEGSVADVSRRGLLCADRALRERGLSAEPLLQVHDEVLFEVADDAVEEAAEVAAEAMRSAYSLEVPLRVGAEAGPNWAELQPLG